MDNKKTIDNDKIYKNYFFDVINSLSTNSKCIKHNKLNLNHESITVRAQRDSNPRPAAPQAAILSKLNYEPPV